MLDRIVHRFLRNTIKMSGHIRVMNENRFVNMQAARDIK